MKKVIIIFILIFATINLMAQEHLSFKGIPIKGSMTEFCQKLKAKGFTLVGSEKNVALFSGNFTGQKVIIGVKATDDGKNVFCVGILFDLSDEWNILVETYSYYKDLYSRKYGKPAISKEKNPALSNSNTPSNTDLMREVYEGRVEWVSAWKVTGGNIELLIEKISDFYKGMVTIRYRDSLNVEAKIQKDLEDI